MQLDSNVLVVADELVNTRLPRVNVLENVALEQMELVFVEALVAHEKHPVVLPFLEKLVHEIKRDFRGVVFNRDIDAAVVWKVANVLKLILNHFKVPFVQEWDERGLKAVEFKVKDEIVLNLDIQGWTYLVDVQERTVVVYWILRLIDKSVRAEP